MPVTDGCKPQSTTGRASLADRTMARLGRYFLPDQPLHAIQLGNNREAIFFAEDDYACDRDWLAAAAAEYGCAIHPQC